MHSGVRFSCRHVPASCMQVMKGARSEWNRAVSFYKQAASVLPSSGNPFNQMAVMAYYGSDELRAVYYYFR